MKNSNKANAGFTLIELMLIMGITAIIGSIAVSSIAGFRSQKTLDLAADELVAHLRDAQQKSISQNESSQWGVHIAADAVGDDYYEVFYGSAYSGGTVTEKYALPSNVIFLAPAQGAVEDVIFSKVTGYSIAPHSIVIVLADNHSIGRSITIPAGIILITSSKTVPSQDISFTISPLSALVMPGNSANTTLTLTLLSGASKAVSFSVSNLPGGASASFNPVECAPTCVSEMIIATSLSTPAGSSNLIITAQNSDVLKTKDFILNVAAAAPSEPSAPQNLVASGGVSQIALNWQAPSSDGGSAITNYKIYRGIVSGGETYLATVGNVLTYIDSGLGAGETYYYKVSAVNAVGEGNLSNEASAATQASAPSSPQNLTATGGVSEIVLNWQAPASNGGSTITNYKIYRGTTSGGETYLTTVGNVLTYTNSGLTGGITYYYKVSAVNLIGEGGLSNEANAILAFRVFVTSSLYNGKLYGLIGADQKCQARAGAASLGGSWRAWLSDSTAVISSRLNHSLIPYKLLNGQIIANNWSDLTDGSIINPIRINELGNDVGSSVNVWTGTMIDEEESVPVASSQNCSNWTSNGGGITGLVGRTQYYSNQYWTNYTGGGCDGSNRLYCIEQSIFLPEITVPIAPILNRAVSANARVPIYWSAPDYDGGSAVMNYKIYRGATSGGETLLATVGSVTKYLDENSIVNGATYYYKVSAVNAAGESLLSNELSVVPANAYLVFRSSVGYNGNLGNLSGADLKCQTLAANAGLGGITWKAWLSDGSTSASSRLYHALVPYKTVNNAVVANNWTDLVDGNLISPFSIDENGSGSAEYLWQTAAWTNTKIDGTKKYTSPSTTCANWSSSSSGNVSLFGSTANTNSLWTDYSLSYCDSPLGIYCFEQ